MNDSVDPGPGEAQPNESPLEKIQHSTATARVPDDVGRGVFATGAIVLGGSEEFTIDFVLGLGHPGRFVARVILPPGVARRFAAALDESLGKYVQRFGTLPRDPGKPSEPPQPVPQRPIAEVYDSLKLPDDMLAGVYANIASITFTGSEFCFDFIAGLFPRSVVAARVYMAAPHVPELLASVRRSAGAG
jgi:hypothetical protein